MTTSGSEAQRFLLREEQKADGVPTPTHSGPFPQEPQSSRGSVASREEPTAHACFLAHATCCAAPCFHMFFWVLFRFPLHALWFYVGSVWRPVGSASVPCGFPLVLLRSRLVPPWPRLRKVTETKGSQMEPTRNQTELKETSGNPTGTKTNPKGSQRKRKGNQRNPKGTKTKPKGVQSNQRGTEREPT